MLTYRNFSIILAKGLVFLLLTIIAQLNLNAQVDSILGPTQIDPDEFQFKMLVSDNKILLDVRTKSEYADMHIHGAVWIENRAALQNYLDTFDREQPVFIYCQFGFRSETASKVIAEMGFIHVYSMHSGLEGWMQANYPVQKKRIFKKK